MSEPGLERHPRQPLSFRLTRSELFGSLRSELERKAASERPAYKLTTLGALPDDRLAGIVPVLVSGGRLSVVEGAVWGRRRPDAPPRRLFAADRANLAVLEAIDGRTPLGAIADTLGCDPAGPADHSFARVRDVFLALVLARVAEPM